MVKPAQPRPLALPQNRIGNNGSWASPVGYDNSRSSPVATNGRTLLGAVEMPAPPATSAEVAQARVFEAILQAEFARLNALAYAMAGPLDRLKHPDLGSCQPSRDLMLIHARIDEVQRLLAALQGRFPHTGSNGEPTAGANTRRVWP
jgi:hypothetical protein